jgi:hypothetical protein
MNSEIEGGSRSGPPAASRAIVVFEDRAQVACLAWLRPGFRHCFCLVRRPVGWVVCDPLKAVTTLDVIADYEERELLVHYRRRGMVAIAGDCRPGSRPGPVLRPLTCVELVKRIVGLRAAGVWTPHQLYRVLRERGFREEAPSCDRPIDNHPNQA